MPYFLATCAVASWLPPTSDVTSTSGMRLSASRCFCPNAPCPATQIFISFLRTHKWRHDHWARHCERSEGPTLPSSASGEGYVGAGLLCRSAPRNDDQPRIRSTFARAAARLSLPAVRLGFAADLRAPPRARLARIMWPTAVFDAGTV